MEEIMDGEIKNFIKVWFTTISCLCYCYYIASKIPKGFLRLLSLLPILYLFLILPLNLSSYHLGGPTTFFLVWLATFKLLLFSFNQGPLALSSPNIAHFISIASLPINLKQHPPQTNTNHTKTTQKPKWLLLLKVLILAMIIHAYDYREHLHPHFILVLYCCHMYLGIELVLALSAAPVRTVFGFDIEPQFNEPYLSTSLQDFWGRRWNLMVTRILRPTVYHPVYRMCTHFVGPSCALSTAVLATFLVSGLMHELIYYYLTRAPPTWEVTCFFVLHGVCTAVEVTAKKVMLRHGWRLPRAVSGPLVVAFLAVTGRWLFFPQLLRNGVDRKAIGEYAILVNFVKSKKRKRGVAGHARARSKGKNLLKQNSCTHKSNDEDTDIAPLSVGPKENEVTVNSSHVDPNISLPFSAPTPSMLYHPPSMAYHPTVMPYHPIYGFVPFYPQFPPAPTDPNGHKMHMNTNFSAGNHWYNLLHQVTKKGSEASREG